MKWEGDLGTWRHFRSMLRIGIMGANRMVGVNHEWMGSLGQHARCCD